MRKRRNACDIMISRPKCRVTTRLQLHVAAAEVIAAEVIAVEAAVAAAADKELYARR